MRPDYDPFSYINRSYGLNAKKGSRVEYTGGADRQLGTVTGVDGAHLMIRMDGQKAPRPYHPTWELRFL